MRPRSRPLLLLLLVSSSLLLVSTVAYASDTIPIPAAVLEHLVSGFGGVLVTVLVALGVVRRQGAQLSAPDPAEEQTTGKVRPVLEAEALRQIDQRLDEIGEDVARHGRLLEGERGLGAGALARLDQLEHSVCALSGKVDEALELLRGLARAK